MCESEQETAVRGGGKVTLAAELLQPGLQPALYVSSVLPLYVDLADTPLRASAT